jgi:undecaprenyl-diphosphatase
MLDRRRGAQQLKQLLLETIKKIDQAIFFAINGWNNAFLDQFFWIVSLVVTWIPLYVLFAILIVKKFGTRCWVPLLAAGLLVLATDKSSVFFKNQFQRYRPTHNLVLKTRVHKVHNDEGGKFGFVSSHAANTWGLAVYLILLLSYRKKYFTFLLLFWAALVSYGRVYAGVHYPSDVAGGAVLGILLAFLIFKLQNFILMKYFKHQTV